MTTMTQGQAITLTSQWFEYTGGPPSDVATLTITVSSPDGTTIYLAPTADGIGHSSVGNYYYVWDPGTPPPVGSVLVSWTGTDSSGQPISAAETVTVLAASPTPSGALTPTSEGALSLLDDRLFISRYATQQVGFTAVVNGQPADVDSDAVTCYMSNADTGVQIFQRSADHLGTGIYGVTLSGVDTAPVAPYDLLFNYRMNGIADMSVVPIQVGPAYPAYDSLNSDCRAIVERVWFRFADNFDSALGGPYLQTLLQTHFTRNRIAQLSRVAVDRLNTISQPHMTYTLDDPNAPFPTAQWGGLLAQATYVEVIKHLIRSYVEQPQVNLSSAISRLDRRDYMPRWMDLLQIEQKDLNDMLETFKIENMGLGNSAVLVAGGAYGSQFGPTVSGPLGVAAARGYFPTRFYG